MSRQTCESANCHEPAVGNTDDYTFFCRKHAPADAEVHS